MCFAPTGKFTEPPAEKEKWEVEMLDDYTMWEEEKSTVKEILKDLTHF